MKLEDLVEGLGIIVVSTVLCGLLLLGITFLAGCELDPRMLTEPNYWETTTGVCDEQDPRRPPTTKCD